jgi:hypothetical protein
MSTVPTKDKRVVSGNIRITCSTVEDAPVAVSLPHVGDPLTGSPRVMRGWHMATVEIGRIGTQIFHCCTREGCRQMNRDGDGRVNNPVELSPQEYSVGRSMISTSRPACSECGGQEHDQYE